MWHTTCTVSTLNAYVTTKIIKKNYVSFKNVMSTLKKKNLKTKKKSTLGRKEKEK